MNHIERFARLFATLIVFLAGCGHRTATSTGAGHGHVHGRDDTDTHIDLEFGDIIRSYELHVPPSYDGSAPLPLVLNFHGFTSSGNRQRLFSRMDKTADEHGFIVAYPNGLSESWNAGVCCGLSAKNDVDDVGFTRAIIDDLDVRGYVDRSRVYATGMSNGGVMTHRLACEASDVIAAIAPVAGVLGVDPSACNPTRPVPVIHFHGMDDDLVPYEGGGFVGFISVNDSVKGWIDRNACSGEPEVTFSEGMVTCETIDRCAEGSSVTLCTVEGGGHCWPGQPCTMIEGVGLGVGTADINANDAMWDLFSTIKLP